MTLKAALAPLLLCLVSGAPQPQGQSVSCRTEYSVVWDTQYQEKETQECVTNYEKVCHTVNERLCKVRIDWSTEGLRVVSQYYNCVPAAHHQTGVPDHLREELLHGVQECVC